MLLELMTSIEIVLSPRSRPIDVGAKRSLERSPSKVSSKIDAEAADTVTIDAAAATSGMRFMVFSFSLHEDSGGVSVQRCPDTPGYWVYSIALG